MRQGRTVSLSPEAALNGELTCDRDGGVEHEGAESQLQPLKICVQRISAVVAKLELPNADSNTDLCRADTF